MVALFYVFKMNGLDILDATLPLANGSYELFDAFAVDGVGSTFAISRPSFPESACIMVLLVPAVTVLFCNTALVALKALLNAFPIISPPQSYNKPPYPHFRHHKLVLPGRMLRYLLRYNLRHLQYKNQ